ncbi:MAG: branched-chain amino acid transaminase [Thermotogota bacterium]
MQIQSRHAYFEGRIVSIENAKVSIMTAALNYGLAVFEGIRAYWDRAQERLLVFRLADHLDRFWQNGRILFMEPPVSREVLTDAMAELLRHEAFRGDVYLRPLLYKSTCEIGPRVHDSGCDVSIFATPLDRYVNTQDGIAAIVSSWRRVGDAAIPPRGKISGSYVTAALSKSEALLAGVDEALLLNESGSVSEGTVSNLFIVRDGVLITPPISAGILEGITRRTVLTLASELGIEVAERAVLRSELYAADEVMLTGTATELAPVVEVDRRPVGDRTPGPIVRRLAKAFDDVAHGRSDRHTDWCTPVSL